MFTHEIAEAILNSEPDNCNGRKFREVFSEAWVRFTHFAVASDDHVFNTHTMIASLAES